MCFISYSLWAGGIIVHTGAFQLGNLEIINVTFTSHHLSNDSFIRPQNIYWVLLLPGTFLSDGFGALIKIDNVSVLTEFAFWKQNIHKQIHMVGVQWRKVLWRKMNKKWDRKLENFFPLSSPLVQSSLLSLRAGRRQSYFIRSTLTNV